jgi:hypothetical protein
MCLTIGIPQRPPPGGWPVDPNDNLSQATLLILPDDPLERRTSVRYEDLSLHTANDRDFFRVRLPDDQGAGCACLCGVRSICNT